MKKHFHKILFVATVALLSLVLFQTFTGLLPLPALNGAVMVTEKPKLTLKSYTDGTFQSETEKYLREHCGFREWLIRAYNQWLWSCFGEANNSTIMEGKDGWLFEEVYVRDHYESSMYKYTDDTAAMKQIFETEALRMWKVQELLKEHGIHIFVNINPGKDVIYPEYLPENKSYSRPVGVRAYEFYIKRFNELGINYIDNVPIFKAIKNSAEYPLYYKTGIHWSNISAVHVFDSIIRYIEVLGNQNLNNIEIGEKYEADARYPDNDLEKVLNLAFKIKSPPYYYADVKVVHDSTAEKPSLLTIGDSFYWNFVFNIPMLEIFRKAPYWYYNYEVHGDEEHENGSTLDLDLDSELMSADYIMLNYGTLQLYELGSQFLPNALVRLCFDKEATDSIARKVMKIIEANPEWHAETVRSAKARNISVEQALYENALYLIRTEPEKYIDELSGDKLPVSRNKNLIKLRAEKKRTFAYSKSQSK